MGNAGSSNESAEEARKKELERMGVLVPPSFGVSTADTLPPSSVAARKPTPSYLENLEKDLSSYRILHEHMSSGLWVSASTPSQASVLASFAVSGDASSAEGMLSASQRWDQGFANIRAYTSQPAHVSANLTQIPGLTFDANANTSGFGWLGCHASPVEWRNQWNAKPAPQQYYRNDPFADESGKNEKPTTIQNVQVGASLTFQSPPKVSDLSDVQVQDVRGYASMDVAACKVAMETTVPFKTLEPQIAYHISCDLNTEEGPPLIVTMQHGPTRSSMSLSQVLTFDRYVLNALETRCPRIRNTLGWAVQMEKETDANAQLKAGLAWQMNRGIAIKMVVDPNGVKAGVLLKRWKQPRVLCSLLAGISPGQEQPSLGFGLELETGPTQGQDYYTDEVEGRGHVSDEVPATKATLPDDDLSTRVQ